MKDEREFDATWRHYSAATQATPSQTDHYGHSYHHYGPAPVFPHHSYHSGADSQQSSTQWSNGTDLQPFLSQYESQQQQGHYAMEAMFGSNNYFGQNQLQSSAPLTNPMANSFNFFPSSSDPFWPSSSGQSKSSRNPYRVHQEETSYYHQEPYQTMPDLKHVDTALAGLTLDHINLKSETSLGINRAFADPKKPFDALGSSGPVGQVPKKTTWASIASQPAKPAPKSLKSKMSSSVLTGSTSKHLPPVSASMETIGTWEAKNGQSAARKTPPQTQGPPLQAPPPSQAPSMRSQAPPTQTTNQTQAVNSGVSSASGGQWRNQEVTRSQSGSAKAPEVGQPVLPAHPVLDKLRVENNYNPKELELAAKNARFFIIKSYSEDDIHRSIKYSIWCSTEHGNKRLDTAFRQQQDKGPIYLLFSVNGSGHFCGMAQMTSQVDYHTQASVWAQDKWKGQFKVKWIYVKDVPNTQLRHIRLENNENKPVTNSRDTQEVPPEKGRQVVKIMHHYRHTTSIFDDFLHYEKRQEEESARRTSDPPASERPPPVRGGAGRGWGGSGGRSGQ